MSGKVLIVDSGSEALRFLVAKVKELESDLASERESRKQAEDALVDLMNEYESQRCQFSSDRLWTKHEDMEAVQKARGIVSTLLSEPIPQEPAERERGK